MERHLSTGVSTIVALMEADRAVDAPPAESRCPWLRLLQREAAEAERPADEPLMPTT